MNTQPFNIGASKALSVPSPSLSRRHFLRAAAGAWAAVNIVALCDVDSAYAQKAFDSWPQAGR